jgi:hypothetical protein
MGIDTLAIVIAAPIVMMAARTAVAFFKSWLTKKGSNIEIRVGNRIISTINSGEDKSTVLGAIQGELIKDAKERSGRSNLP